MKKSVVMFVLVSLLLALETCCESIIIATPQGKVEGFLKKTDNGTVRVFMGLPFAKPPIGNLRLKAPQPAENFENYNATFPRPTCIQTSKSPATLATMLTNNGSTVTIPQKEDCLYLNIFTPEKVTKSVEVMVWIHGGAFQTGSGVIYDPSNLVLRGNVVLVTINYRLGWLGFFPGGAVENNLGLRDQIMALKWVQENIKSYGGDPEKVTIFGESAGSKSVSFLTISPMAKGLFKRAICQSGVAISPWFPVVDAKIRRQQLLQKGRELGCKSANVVECAREISIEKWSEFTSGDITPYTYPAIDNDVIMEDYASNQALLHPDLEIIYGLNLNDGGMFIVIFCTNFYTKKCNPSDGYSIQQLWRSVRLPSSDKNQIETLMKTYNNWYPKMKAPEGKMSLDSASELATDIQYRMPVNKTATKGFLNGNKVYVYQFNVKLKKSMLPWSVPWSEKADHAEELGFLFSWVEPDDPNYAVSLNMIDMWTNFAKGKMVSHWPKFTPSQASYLLIDKDNQAGVARSPLINSRKNNFWREFETKGTFPEWWVTAGTGRVHSSGLTTMLMVGLKFVVR